MAMSLDDKKRLANGGFAGGLAGLAICIYELNKDLNNVNVAALTGAVVCGIVAALSLYCKKQLDNEIEGDANRHAGFRPN